MFSSSIPRCVNSSCSIINIADLPLLLIPVSTLIKGLSINGLNCSKYNSRLIIEITSIVLYTVTLTIYTSFMGYNLNFSSGFTLALSTRPCIIINGYAREVGGGLLLIILTIFNSMLMVTGQTLWKLGATGKEVNTLGQLLRLFLSPYVPVSYTHLTLPTK